ncbi:MAG: hypothetical protein KTR30_01230 [Saprospiraceae bacterium]|nr:hypothetical protein [Saprospiraceae bacterium]
MHLPKLLGRLSYALLIAFLFLGFIACKSEAPPPNSPPPPPTPTLDTVEAMTPPPPPELPAPTCLAEGTALQEFLTAFSVDIEQQKILYKSEPLSDCSGMFLRLCEAVKQKCPDLIFPNPDEIRDTRMLGKWYADQDNFTIISDALESGNQIKAGTVMFYGHQRISYPNATLADLIAEDGIEHMGVVTEVDTDENGVVKSYKLFHGRSTGKIAGRTGHHHRKTSRETYPPYGNGDQQWVAMAWLLTPGPGS